MEFKVRATHFFICVYVRAKFRLALINSIKKEIACVSCSMFSLQPSRPGCDNLRFLGTPMVVLELYLSWYKVQSTNKVLDVQSTTGF